MATTKRRLNITLSKEAGAILTEIAKRDQVPEATKVSELLNISLALEEDKAFTVLAESRLNTKGKKLSHSDIWSR